MDQGGTGGVSRMTRGQLVESAIKIGSREKDFVCQRVRKFCAEQNGCINIWKVVRLSDATRPAGGIQPIAGVSRTLAVHWDDRRSCDTSGQNSHEFVDGLFQTPWLTDISPC